MNVFKISRSLGLTFLSVTLFALGSARAADSVSSISLIEASNAAVLGTITNGEVLQLSSFPAGGVSIRANTSPATVGSVKFVLDGTYTHNENIAPYSLCGDATTRYTACTALNTAGKHTLSVTAYTGSNASGTAGAAYTVSFTVESSVSSFSSGCGVTGKPTGDFHLSTTDGNGTKRDYEVMIPSTYKPTSPLALTIAYHGLNGTEAAAKAFGIQNASGAAAASIFIFPQGIAYESYGVGWDDNCGGRDTVFFDNMVKYLESNYCVDTKKLNVAGFSWGCDQVTALACCRGNKIAAVSAASCTDEFSNPSSFSTYHNLPCPVANAAAIRFTHDVKSDGAYTQQEFVSTSELYRSFNSCTSNSVPVSPSPCVSYDSCKKPVVECEYSNLGHNIPANWGNDTWSFFQAN